MTNNSNLQVQPDFYRSKEDCEKNTYRQVKQTNPRYKNFTQTSLGDEEQFSVYGLSKFKSFAK